jgi:hypothetical protein
MTRNSHFSQPQNPSVLVAFKATEYGVHLPVPPPPIKVETTPPVEAIEAGRGLSFLDPTAQDLHVAARFPGLNLAFGVKALMQSVQCLRLFAIFTSTASAVHCY